MKILVTGCAGFIGMHVCRRLLERGDDVIGIDNLNKYNDPSLKLARLAQLEPYANFRFAKINITDCVSLQEVFEAEKPHRVIHLAAQVGVRYSMENPHSYVQSNLVGFVNILESCRHHHVEHLVYASSSSVYGANTKMPFAAHDNVDHPISLSAAFKKANELMAHTYSHLYGLPTTGLRYFTVYGPWARPDTLPWLFTSAILEGRAIDLFNHGNMLRDFTYIDDVVDGTIRVLDKVAKPDRNFSTDSPDAGASYAPYRIYNIGSNRPVKLVDFISALEKAMGKSAIKNMLPMQPGDLMATSADIEDIRRDTGFAPSTSIEEGLANWVQWYTSYRN